MEIIEKPESMPWSIEETCTGSGNSDSGCGAVLRIYKEDLFMTNDGYSHIKDHMDIFFTFKCICCGSLTDVLTENIPESLRPYLPTKEQWKNNK